MSFDIKKWIQSPHHEDDTKTVKIAGEEIRIRRLNGTQWEQYMQAMNGRSADSVMVVVLQHGIVKPFGQYTYEEIAKFCNANPIFADKIATAILELTSERMIAEQQALEDAEKNSEMTDTSSPSDDGAESTDKIPKPPKSAEKNFSALKSTSS